MNWLRLQGLILPLAILAALALAALACVGPVTSNSASLTIVNDTTQALCKVYVSPNTGVGWAGERLGGTRTIGVGERFTVTDIEPGVYNLRAETCSGDAAERYDQTIENQVEWTVTD